MVAWWTGGAWVLYFADAPTLVKDLATFQAPLVAYVWIGILTFTTYALAGHMREQVCLYMCPWPRIQAALTDEYALNVTYRYDRGEPRGSVKKNAALRAQGMPAGDCIDCYQCVYVCPTGVDIRNGPNLGCIQCGLCIDACDAVMAKIGRPARLIAYDTDLNIKRRQEGKPADLQDRAHAHGVLCGDHRDRRRGDALHAGDAAERGRSASSMTAIRCSCGCPTASSATASPCASSTSRSSARSFVLTVEGLADIDLKIVGDTVTSGPHGGHRGRSRPDPRIARAGEHVFAAAARSLDPADLPHHRCEDRRSGRARSTISADHENAAMSASDSSSGDGRPPREVTGRMVLVCLVAFFAVVAGVNAVMIRAAVSTFGGVETESAYQAGLAFARRPPRPQRRTRCTGR